MVGNPEVEFSTELVVRKVGTIQNRSAGQIPTITVQEIWGNLSKLVEPQTGTGALRILLIIPMRMNARPGASPSPCLSPRSLGTRSSRGNVIAERT
jgi:hypothetical protein